jgi:hypothetical protein
MRLVIALLLLLCAHSETYFHENYHKKFKYIFQLKAKETPLHHEIASLCAIVPGKEQAPKFVEMTDTTKLPLKALVTFHATTANQALVCIDAF